ncbi:MAG: hypothetical protein WAL75_10205 [Terracidiphilus sp.]
MTKRTTLVALLAIVLLVLEPTLPVQAQEPAAPPKSLQIVILGDEAPLNNISERTAREPIVQVQDENHKPVAGALVLFFIHPGLSGAGATFADGAGTLTVETGADGMARATGLVTNQYKGSWQLQVTASKNGLTTSTTINEKNGTPDTTTSGSTSPKKPPTHLLGTHGMVVIGGIAVIGGVVAFVVVKAISNSPTNISAGNGTVGAPGSGFKIHF